MNISKALRKIKSLKNDINEEKLRLLNPDIYTDSEPSIFKFKEKFSNISFLYRDLADTKSKIEEKNATTKVKLDDKEVTISFILNSIEEIKSKISVINSFVVSNNITSYNLEISEFEKHKMIHDLREELEKLTAILENYNYTTTI